MPTRKSANPLKDLFTEKMDGEHGASGGLADLCPRLGVHGPQHRGPRRTRTTTARCGRRAGLAPSPSDIQGGSRMP